MIFKRVGEGRPYPEHGLSARDWSSIRPEQVRLADLVTTRRELDLERVLVDDSTYFGDLFAHVVQWRGDLYLEDGLHRALRAALSDPSEPMLHARVLALPDGEDATTG
jgi:Arc/MetJ family transcription regulator